jgi:hypothetical protein
VHGVALLATGTGLEASFSGLCVVCGSCLVVSSGFMGGGGEAHQPNCLENAGAQWRERAMEPT